MESYLLEHAADNRRRLVAFTGPIFSDVDRVRPGMDIPLLFFKVAVFIHEGELAASWPRWTGGLLPQPPEQLQSVPPGVS